MTSLCIMARQVRELLLRICYILWRHVEHFRLTNTAQPSKILLCYVLPKPSGPPTIALTTMLFVTLLIHIIKCLPLAQRVDLLSSSTLQSLCWHHREMRCTPNISSPLLIDNLSILHTLLLRAHRCYLAIGGPVPRTDIPSS